MFPETPTKRSKIVNDIDGDGDKDDDENRKLSVMLKWF